jgi:hypothetical protein
MARKPAPKEDASPPAPRTANGAKQPVSMNDLLFERILERVANGAMLMQLEKEPDFPSRSTILSWINAAPERREQYEMARRDQADYFSEQLDDVNAKLLAGTIDPASARALSDNLKWSAKVGRPERYGDKSQVDLNVSRVHSDDSPDELRARIIKTIGSLPLLPEANDAEN